MTQTDSIKLAFFLALATILAAFAFAGASDTVLYDGMTCELIQGNGTEGLQCQELDNKGELVRGMSLACGGEYDGLCQQARKDTGSPKKKSKNSQSRNVSPEPTADSPLLPSGQGQSTAQQEATCRNVGNGGLECQDNATGAWFSTTCDLRSDLCAQTPAQDATGCTQSYCPLPKKSGSDGNQTSTNGDLTSQNVDASVNLDPQLRDAAVWEQFSESDLLQANNTVNKFIAENSGRWSSKAKSQLSALQGTIHKAYARVVSRRVIGAISEEYRSRDGIYERPKLIKIEGILTADTVVAQLLRDVTLWEECQRQVRHVDMLKQCADTPFGQSRLFRY